MKAKKIIRIIASILLAGTILTWVIAGSNTGWTKTVINEMQTDEITGLEFPVEKKVFYPGVDFLGMGSLLAIGIFTTSLIIRKKKS